MKLDLEFAELHTPLFFDGVNFGTKLYADPKKSKAPIKMWYDTELKHTVVVYNNKVAIIESTASKTLTNPKDIGVEVKATPPVKKPDPFVAHVVPQIKAQVTGPEKTIRTAQVSTPHDKVQGAPKRKAKFQGEESQGE